VVKKFMITGSNGILGSEFIKYFKENSIDFSILDYKDILDLAHEDLIKIISGVDILIHCAANTNVEWCEKNEDLCNLHNVVLTNKLSKICKVNSIKLIFISSTGVYGDHKAMPYSETDLLEPTTVHHLSKKLAENSVILISKNNLILRVGWLFGGEFKNKKNFVARRLEEMLSASLRKTTLYSDIEQKGCPSWTYDVVKGAIILIQKNKSGVFNVCNSGCASRFDYVYEISKIARGYGLDGVNIKGVGSAFFSRIANVSRNETANNSKLNIEALHTMPPWQESLRKYLSEMDIISELEKYEESII